MNSILSAISASKAKTSEARTTRIRKRHVTPLITGLFRRVTNTYGEKSQLPSMDKFQHALRHQLKRTDYEHVEKVLNYAIDNWPMLRKDTFNKTVLPEWPVLMFLTSSSVFSTVETLMRRDAGELEQFTNERTYKSIVNELKIVQQQLKELQDERKRHIAQIDSLNAEIVMIRRDYERRLAEKSKQSRIAVRKSGAHINDTDLLPADRLFSETRKKR